STTSMKRMEPSPILRFSANRPQGPHSPAQCRALKQASLFHVEQGLLGGACSYAFPPFASDRKQIRDGGICEGIYWGTGEELEGERQAEVAGRATDVKARLVAHAGLILGRAREGAGLNVPL